MSNLGKFNTLGRVHGPGNGVIAIPDPPQMHQKLHNGVIYERMSPLLAILKWRHNILYYSLVSMWLSLLPDPKFYSLTHH